MSLFVIVAYSAVLIIIVASAMMVLGAVRSKGSIARALNMSLFLVTLPRQEAAGQEQRPEKELIGVMEQLYASWSSIHARGWNRFLHGEPYLALEMAVHHVGEEIHFYVAVPRGSEETLEKQLHGVYPSAEIQRVKDFNIFNPTGAHAGGIIRLKGDPVLPMQTYLKLQSDPLGGIATALSKLDREGQGAAIQVLIRPSHQDGIRKLAQKVAHYMQSGYDFKQALLLGRGKKEPPKDKKEEETLKQSRVITPFEEETIKALQNKASRPLFDANIRILVSAQDQDAADRLLKEVSGAFDQFANPELNGLVFYRQTDRGLKNLTFNYAFRIFDDSRRLYLSSEELTSIFHFPTTLTRAPRIKFQTSRFAEPPPNLPMQGIVIGANIFRGQERLVRISDDDRRRHLYIVGQTGTGKTTFLKQMIAQDITQGKGVCVIDPHGDLADYALSVVPPARAGDTVYFNPGDIEMPLGLNMLEIDPSRPEQKTFVANEMLAIVKSLYHDIPEAFGPMFEQYFKNAVLLLLDDYALQVPTLAEIPRVLADAAYRKDKLSREANPLVKNFWVEEAEKAGGEGSLENMVPYITSKLNPFLANDYMRPIVGQQKSAFNFRDVIDKQKILIVNLSKGRIGDVNASLLGMILVGKLLMASLSRVDMPEAERRDFYLYIDEFQNFTTESIAVILSEARKYRLDLIIAHQFIRQLADPIRDAVFGNVGSMVAFRVGPDDAEFLKGQFGPVFTEADLAGIDNFNAHVRLLVSNQVARPFNIKTIIEPAGSAETAQEVKERSRTAYGRPRADVEGEIQQRYRQKQANV